MALSAALILGLFSTGCSGPVTSVINQSIRSDEARATKNQNTLLAAHMKLIDKLRAEGDPIGDYLWVKANEDKFVPNAITDRSTLIQMYGAAAAKGSVDAEIRMGLLTFYEGSAMGSGFQKDKYQSLSDSEKKQKEQLWRKGLDIMDKATAKRCYYWAVVLDGMANRSCLRPATPAMYVWYEFRDGWSYPKDNSLLSYWKAKEESCQVFLNSQRGTYFLNPKLPTCR